MINQAKKVRILGVAFLLQFLTSFTCGVFILPMATGVESFGEPAAIGDTMATIVKNAELFQGSIILELLTGVGVIFLGAILYGAVKKGHEGLALTAFGLYILEGVMIAVKMLVLFGLLVISRQYIADARPVALEQTATMINETVAYASKILNFAFCLGATIFYALLFRLRTVPRALSLWGLISVQGVFVGGLLGFFTVKAPLFLFVPYIPFELVIGLWIVIRGLRVPSWRPESG